MARNNTKKQKRDKAQATHCAFCNKQLHDKGRCKRTIEHFYPLVTDPKHLNRGWNKLVICTRCNGEKNSLMPEAYIRKLQKEIVHLQTKIDNVSRHQERLEGYYSVREII